MCVREKERERERERELKLGFLCHWAMALDGCLPWTICVSINTGWCFGALALSIVKQDAIDVTVQKFSDLLILLSNTNT